MSARARTLILWLYVIATIVTFFGVAGIVAFEAYVRWTLNQNFAFLDGNALAGLAILLAAQMIGLAWISRSH